MIVGDCPFCDAKRVLIDNEHAFPEWILKVVRQRRGKNKILILRYSRYGRVIHEYPTRDPETLVKGPCKDVCNGGWMKKLEDQVIPFFRPMILDQMAFLDRTKRLALARWAVKTAMVFDINDFPNADGYFTDDDRSKVRGGLFPLREIRLWAARSSSPRPLSFDPVPLWVRLPGAPAFLAYCATIIIECVTLQLLIYPLDVASWLQGLPTTNGPWDRLVQIFPNYATEPLVWPPVAKEYFDEDLRDLRGRFITGQTKPSTSWPKFPYGPV